MNSSNTNILSDHFPNLSAKQWEQFKSIAPLYTIWNSRLNLISRRDIEHIYLRHVLHALCIAKVVQFVPGTRILDVGTGGGFPGIPLAIMFPDTSFHLIDSIGKKVRAVAHIAQELELTNVTTEQIRAENVRDKYDFILGRAVTDMATFYSWIGENIADCNQHAISNGIFYLRGMDDLSLEGVPLRHTVYPIQDFFEDPFFETKRLVHLFH